MKDAKPHLVAEVLQQFSGSRLTDAFNNLNALRQDDDLWTAKVESLSQQVRNNPAFQEYRDYFTGIRRSLVQYMTTLIRDGASSEHIINILRESRDTLTHSDRVSLTRRALEQDYGDVIVELLQASPDNTLRNMTDGDGNSWFAQAVCQGNINAAQSLCALNPFVLNVRNRQDTAPMAQAITRGHANIVEFIATQDKHWLRSSGNPVTNDAPTPNSAELAVQSGQLECLRVLLDLDPTIASDATSYGYNLLFNALHHEQYDIAQLIYNRFPNQLTETIPLGINNFCYMISNNKLDQALWYYSQEVERLGGEHRVTLFDYVDNEGNPMIHHAIQSDSIAMVDLVLSKGSASFSEPDQRGVNLLHKAILLDAENVFSHLFERYLNLLFLPDHNGESPADLLIKKGDTSEIKRFISNNQDAIASIDVSGSRVLQSAFESGDESFATILVEANPKYLLDLAPEIHLELFEEHKESYYFLLIDIHSRMPSIFTEYNSDGQTLLTKLSATKADTFEIIKKILEISRDSIGTLDHHNRGFIDELLLNDRPNDLYRLMSLDDDVFNIGNLLGYAIIKACEAKKFDSLDSLFKLKPKLLMTKNCFEETFVVTAAKMGSSQTVAWLDNNYGMLEKPINPDTWRAEYPIEQCIRSGNLTAVRIMVEQNQAVLSQKNAKKQNVLCQAILSKANEVAGFIADQAPDLLSKPNDGKYPLAFMANHRMANMIVEITKSAQARPYITIANPRSGETPIMKALKNGDKDSAFALFYALGDNWERLSSERECKGKTIYDFDRKGGAQLISKYKGTEGLSYKQTRDAQRLQRDENIQRPQAANPGGRPAPLPGVHRVDLQARRQAANNEENIVLDQNNNIAGGRGR